MKSPASSKPTAVITGASSGIGHATALAYAGAGHAVVLAARGRDGLEAVAKACRDFGAEALVVPTDVADATAVSRLAEAAIERFGGIDTWINNVGVGVVGLFDRTPIEAHRRVIEANLIGHMNGAHAALAHFRRRRRGTLINMISIGGFAASPYAAAYSASKFGVRGFSEALRAEMAGLPDVHVCEVYPTFVDTPGIGHGANHTGRTVKPPPPLLDPREVAATLLSLATRPRPSTSIGIVAWPGRIAHALAPDLVGKVTMQLTEAALARADPAPVHDGNLYEPSVGTAIDGGFRDARKAAAAPAAAAALFAAAAIGWWLSRSRPMRMR